MSVRKILFSFEGRIGRGTLWFTSLPLVAGHFLVLGMLKSKIRSGEEMAVPVLIICILWCIVFAWASLATEVKRWHDRDKSGWMVLINFIPIVGEIWALVELGFLKGTTGPNRFGDDPLVDVQEASSQNSKTQKRLSADTASP